eukprot:CAMPEP_0172673818 /NCGR_PEP_ID=MMETSP1074-20121228/12387_1 /TAXON_ID=2916 /ORGANISM="Ceratium fusus, Strain PA161109" /LENGTH=246 /DNA_ID=CAMNT_0013491175 /DNA_START=59 /DNA_END=799 /DNA_ORIENTATION=-
MFEGVMFMLCKPEKQTEPIICSAVCKETETSFSRDRGIEETSVLQDRGIEVIGIPGHDAESAEKALEKSTWNVHLSKDGFDQFGMLLFKSEAALLVTSIVQKGAAECHNQNCLENESIPVGSFIVGANGVFGQGDALIAAMAECDELDLVLSAKQPFLVSFDMNTNTTIGVVVGILPNSLLIKEILEEGALAEWNEKFPAFKIITGDHLIQVNDICNNGIKLLHALQAQVQLDILFRRACSVHSFL